MTLMKFKTTKWPPFQWLKAVKKEPSLSTTHVSAFCPPRGPECVSEIMEIQNEVNNSTVYMPDGFEDTWGKFTHKKSWGWRGPQYRNFGDCDDFAVEKYRLLNQMGFGGTTRLVVCTMHVGKIGDYKSLGHLVASVDLGDTTYILCNNKSGVWKWDDGRFKFYRFLYGSVPGKFLWGRVQNRN